LVWQFNASIVLSFLPHRVTGIYSIVEDLLFTAMQQRWANGHILQSRSSPEFKKLSPCPTTDQKNI